MTRIAAVLLAIALAGVLAAGAAAASQRAVCPGPASAGNVRCHARVVVDPSGKPRTASAPKGYGPSDLQNAYNVAGLSPATAGATVAIVDAYHDPTAQSDLNTYRSTFRLPPCQTGCFRQVNQSGGTTAPATNASWAQEISLDLDMVSAICPGCKILLVEASSNSLQDLGVAARFAGAQGGVIAVSNSYGAPEFSGEDQYAGYYVPPAGKAIAITVSTGDSGYGVQFPAALSSVIAVGGTTLTKNSTGGGFTETAWSGAGSGCSAYVASLGWQPTVSGCSNRMVADVSAVANPNTGVAVYDSTPYQGRSGWMVFGGTSAASPIVASVYSLAPAVSSASALYASDASVFDATSGSNGTCSVTVLCTAGAGWDGPTGVGTPNGITSF